MFTKGSTSQGFSETMRKAKRYHPLESNGGRFGAMVKKETGGTSTSVPGARSTPASDKAMDGKANRVPQGTGQRVGSQNRSTAPRNPINRLGAFGHPPKGKTMGSDTRGTHEGMPGKTPENMDGKAGRVPKSGRGGRSTPVDQKNRIARGKPSGARVKQLASKI